MAKVLGVLVVKLVAWALAKASINMAKADLWQARLAFKTLRRDQREVVAGAGEGCGGGLSFCPCHVALSPCAPSPSPCVCSPPQPWLT